MDIPCLWVRQGLSAFCRPFGWVDCAGWQQNNWPLRLSGYLGPFSGSQYVDLSDYWPRISKRRGPRLRKLPWDLEEASDLNFLKSVGAFECPRKWVNLTVKSSEMWVCLHA